MSVMPAAPRHRHARHRTFATRLVVLAVAATALAGGTAVFVSMQGASAAPRSARDATTVSSAGSSISDDQLSATQLSTTVRRKATIRQDRKVQRARRAARRRHLAALAAAKLAREQAAAKASAAAKPSPSTSPSTAPSPPSSGGDAAHSALGECIRNAEEGGSYAWGRGNGGGAYQFQEGTWETYGGAASEYGVAGSAYQDQIFDNAIAAGGASNWTNYDGC
jgi:hypothetical protein